MKSKIKYFLKHPDSIYGLILSGGCLEFLSDEQILKLLWRIKFGKKLDLDHPKSFNEKLQWLKLYDRNPLYCSLVDKYEVKKWIKKKIGADYVIPTYGVWESFHDIDFRNLPEQFVMKCTHNSGGGIICTDKSKLDIVSVKKQMKHQMSKNLYYAGREWPYKNVRPRIIAEKYLGDGTGKPINDYKFMCFHGQVKCSFVCTQRNTPDGLKVTFFDNDWNVLPFERHYPKSNEKIERPKNFSEMLRIAQILSEGIPFVRVDLYETDNRVRFGEMTFYPGCGFEKFTPEEYDYELGDWIDLKQAYNVRRKTE